MSQEITLAFKLSVLNGASKGEFPISSLRPTQTTTGIKQNKQTIATSDTTITFTGLTQARWCAIKNTDSTNYVEIGPDATGMVKMVTLLPGESFPFPISPGITLKAKAHTGAVAIELFALET